MHLSSIFLETGLYESMRKHIQIRQDSQGWTDSQVIMSLILLNLAGGDCVEDLSVLEADEGFCRVLRRVELHDLSRKERREMERRWRKEKLRFVPSPTAVFRYLEAFHDEEEEKKRRPGKAFIQTQKRMKSCESVLTGSVIGILTCLIRKGSTSKAQGTASSWP